jgi:acyl carrier protein
MRKEMALSQEDVLAGLKEIVEEVAGVSASQIELDKNFTDDLEVDSLSMVEVVVAAEERFGVKIPDEAVTDLVTVGDAVNFIINAAK